MPRRRNKKIKQEEGRKNANLEPKRAITRGAKGNANVKSRTSRKKTSVRPMKQAGRPTKTPGGRGLGKAGAKRLGQLLKRAIKEKTVVTGKEKTALPKTPVRLFKYQTNVEAANDKKKVLPRVSQLILDVVSQCKHRGGISMAELKQALAAGGYDVTKNNSRVNLATKRLVKKDTLVQTKGTGASGSFKLSKKKLTDEKQVRTRAMKSWKPTEAGLQAGKPDTKSPKPAGKLPKPGRKSPKQATKTAKQGRNTRKPTRRTAKTGRKSPKPRGKTPQTRRSPKRRGKRPKQARRATRQVARDGKAARKAQRDRRDGPKQTLHAMKYRQRRQRK